MLDCHPEDPRIFFTGGYDGRIILWNVMTGKPIKMFLVGKKCPVYDGFFSPQGNHIAVSCGEGILCLFGIGKRRNYVNTPDCQFFQHGIVFFPFGFLFFLLLRV